MHSHQNNNDVQYAENTLVKKYNQFNFRLFMRTWSNQFVIGALITISLISLTKQAWA